VRTSPLRRSGVDHTVLPANTPHLPLPRSPAKGATTEWTVLAPADEVYYSLIDPVRMKGWVGLVGWLYSGRFTHINGYPSAAGPVQSRESSPVRDRRSTTEPPDQLCKYDWTDVMFAVRWFCVELFWRNILMVITSDLFIYLFIYIKLVSRWLSASSVNNDFRIWQKNDNRHLWPGASETIFIFRRPRFMAMSRESYSRRKQ